MTDDTYHHTLAFREDLSFFFLFLFTLGQTHRAGWWSSVAQELVHRTGLVATSEGGTVSEFGVGASR